MQKQGQKESILGSMGRGAVGGAIPGGLLGLLGTGAMLGLGARQMGPKMRKTIKIKDILKALGGGAAVGATAGGITGAVTRPAVRALGKDEEEKGPSQEEILQMLMERQASDSYADGFMAKCAEYGVNPHALVKWAQFSMGAVAGKTMGQGTLLDLLNPQKEEAAPAAASPRRTPQRTRRGSWPSMNMIWGHRLNPYFLSKSMPRSMAGA